MKVPRGNLEVKFNRPSMAKNSKITKQENRRSLFKYEKETEENYWLTNI